MKLPFTTGLMRTTHFDCEMAALADRHYSRRSIGARQFLYSGRKLVLRNAEGTVLVGWLYPDPTMRMDGQRGYNCAIFRNESMRKASDILLEAEHAAFEKWGPNRLYTYIDPAKTKSILRHGKRVVGFSFRKAGWKPFITKDGKLHLSKAGQWLFVKLWKRGAASRSGEILSGVAERPCPKDECSEAERLDSRGRAMRDDMTSNKLHDKQAVAPRVQSVVRRRTRVIANWQPSRLDTEVIAAEMVVMLGSHGFLACGIPEVRKPETGESIGWHQDNGGQAALLALWSNVRPTEVRFGNGERLQVVDGDVIVIQNDEVFHRSPTYLKKKQGRWFARTFVRDISETLNVRVHRAARKDNG